MTLDELEDETQRPKAPPVENLTPEQQALAGRLAAIHRMYRMELSHIARLMETIRAGLEQPGALAPAVSGMKLAENLALFGTVCGRECGVIASHHDIEEQYLFPPLALDPQPELRAVIRRLTEEHGLIHSLLVDLADAARRLARAPDEAGFEACAEAFQRLDRAIRSHFGYEETELGPVLGQRGVAI